MKKCVIFAASHIEDYSSVKVEKNDLIVCADGGFVHTKRLNITPDVIIGDFDTLSPEESMNCKILRYPPEKDDTDTMLAVKLALSEHCDAIDIYGGFGGRIDHTFANINALAYIKNTGADASLIGDNEYITILKNEEKTFSKKDGYYFSVFSYSEKSVGVYESGVKYPLENATLDNAFPLGVSNEITDDFCSVKVEKGMLLIVFSKKSSPNL